ncbi:kinase-like protein [Gigaspora margarita]|uniref:Kinase-like protein n=1 Tax=Gigaspora margarita TaxID=4874 RepID=A0A8H4A8B2_GIGMA|nr:kinase-like protein [Gigaspora margarita]
MSKIKWLEKAISKKYINFIEYSELYDLKYIDEGGFAIVFMSVWEKNGLTVAIKFNNYTEITINEIQILQKICWHPNLVQFYGITKDPIGQYGIVLQLAEDGNLRQYLKDKFPKLTWTNKIHLAKQIAHGLECLHNNDIICRALHSKDILIHKGQVMITDFGISINETSAPLRDETHGIPAYIDSQLLDPDYNKDYKVNKKSDIYSLGVILWEISSGRLPFQSFNRYEIIINIIHGERERPIKGTPSKYVELYKNCWDHDSNKRPEIKEVLEILKMMDENLKISSEDSEKSFITILTEGIVEPFPHQYEKIDNKVHDTIFEINDQFKLHKEPVKPMNLEIEEKFISLIERQNLYHGLVIDKHGINLASLSASRFKMQPKINLIKTVNFQTKLLLSTDQRTSFLLKNHIDPFAISREDRIWLSDIYRISNSTKDFLSNESLTSDVYLEIKYPQAEIDFKKEQIESFSELYAMIIVGYKLYRMSSIIAKDSLELTTQEIDFDVKDFTKCENILNKWECYITPHDFDAIYLVSIDGETIMRNELDTWMADCLKNSLDSLRIINWKELYPLYEIFDESLQKNIKSILGIDDIAKTYGVKEKVLITGVIPIEDCAYQYRVKFPVNFKSNNYQMFGNLVKSDGKPISKAVIKFKSTNKYGFSANIENFETAESMRLQINWILIGIPAEVGFFSTNTRDIDIINFDSTLITPITNANNWNVIFKVPKGLLSGSILFTSFTYPLSNYAPNFIATIKSYNDEKREIKINVYNPDFTDRINEENFVNDNVVSKQKYSIQWCVLILPGNQKLVEADIGFGLPINLEAIGQSIDYK